MNKQFYTLITGASQGFGRALAIECAARKMNLVLTALPGEGLCALAHQLQLEYPVNVIAIETDLCADGACEELFSKVSELGLGINMLINNAGIGNTVLFKDGRPADYEKQIRLNVLATTMLTRLFIEMLRKNAPSYVMNVGSLASFFSLSKKQVYGATKSYISYFSRSLARELKDENISVSVVCPGGMYTNAAACGTIQTGNYLSRTSGMKPEHVAPVAINGLLKKKQVIVPGKINSAIVLLDKILPRFIVRFFETRTMNRLHNPYAMMDHHPFTQNSLKEYVSI